MALIEKTVVDRIEILPELGITQIRQAKRIIDDVTGEIKAESFHRVVVDVDDDAKADSVALLPEHAAMVKKLWTPELRAKAIKRKEDAKNKGAA